MTEHRKPQGAFDDDVPVVPNLTVFVDEQPPSAGLLDHEGRPLVRQREPIGYIRVQK